VARVEEHELQACTRVGEGAGGLALVIEVCARRREREARRRRWPLRSPSTVIFCLKSMASMRAMQRSMSFSSYSWFFLSSSVTTVVTRTKSDSMSFMHAIVACVAKMRPRKPASRSVK